MGRGSEAPGSQWKERYLLSFPKLPGFEWQGQEVDCPTTFFLERKRSTSQSAQPPLGGSGFKRMAKLESPEGRESPTRLPLPVIVKSSPV